MSPTTRFLVGALIRFVLLGFGVWFAIRADALGEGAPLISRIGITLLFVVLSILVGEVSQMRLHLSLVARGALQAARAGGTTLPEASKAPDPKAPVEILLQALRATSGETQAKAHAHLKRLTGADLPPDPAAWDAWWAEHKDQFGA